MLETIDKESAVLDRQTLVKIDLPDRGKPIYKFMSSAGAIYACVVYGPIFSIVEAA
jgi:hypothetical protein